VGRRLRSPLFLQQSTRLQIERGPLRREDNETPDSSVGGLANSDRDDGRRAVQERRAKVLQRRNNTGRPPPRACLDQHKAELSEACKAKLEMGKEVAEGACKEDGQKFCKGSADFFACLDQHKAELSEACKAKLEMEDVFTFSVTNVVIALIGLISALVGFVMVCRIWIEERAKGG